ncbi:MAG: hypothetical protein ACK5WW_04910 [Brevundimonas sp.]|jgi:hypothetical protein|uniref:hypothetical protein n=2 Tax=Brevundimonas sp. TaxID=1871086 RepID=UPI003918AF01
MVNTVLVPALSATNVVACLSNPAGATAATYGTHDSVGNSMDCASIVQVAGQPYKYAAVYHTADSNGFYRINLAGSNNLTSWTFIATLLQNASMPKVVPVSNSEWVMIVHEQWQNVSGSGGSAAPCRFAYELYYNWSDLFSGTVRASWTAPQYGSTPLDGTPSVYNASMALSGGFYVVNGQYGFHFFDGTRDVNAVTTTVDLFSPAGTATTSPSTAAAYNTVITNAGAIGSIGQRDTLQTTSARYNIQEGNLSGVSNFADWRIFLYTFGDSLSYPTGNGTVQQLTITTPNGSTSVGNPSVNVVERPNGAGNALVISYMLFAEGAGPGEAGSLIYYYNI